MSTQSFDQLTNSVLKAGSILFSHSLLSLIGDLPDTAFEALRISETRHLEEIKLSDVHEGIMMHPPNNNSSRGKLTFPVSSDNGLSP